MIILKKSGPPSRPRHVLEILCSKVAESEQVVHDGNRHVLGYAPPGHVEIEPLGAVVGPKLRLEIHTVI